MTAERIGQRSPQRDSAHPKNWLSPFKLKFSIFSQEMPFWHGRDLIPQGPSGFDQDGRQEDRVFWTEEDETDTTMVADVWLSLIHI